jgi:hypothetical protein
MILNMNLSAWLGMVAMAKYLQARQVKGSVKITPSSEITVAIVYIIALTSD